MMWDVVVAGQHKYLIMVVSGCTVVKVGLHEDEVSS